MRLSIDRERCCGSGMCVLTGPELFDQDADGLVVLLDATPATAARQEAARQAVELCPCAAISADTGPLG